MANPALSHARPGRTDRPADEAEVSTLLDRLIGHEVAVRFDDCCRLAAGASGLTADLPLLSHGMRELESQLRDTVLSILAIPVSAPPGAEEREADIRRLQAANTLTEGEADTLVRQIKSNGRHRREVTAIGAALELGQQVEKHWLEMAIVRKKGERVHLTRFAHGRSYRERKAANAFFLDNVWTPFKLVFCAILRALEPRYAGFYAVVDQLAASPDKAAAATAFAERTPFSVVLQRRFFSQIEPPDWLPALRDAGLFAEPPPAGDVSNSLDWPAGTFLRRWAWSTDPAIHDQIAAIVQPLLASLNPVVHHHVAELAVHLPALHAVRIAARIPEWLDGAAGPSVAYRAGQLVECLAKGGEREAALVLATTVFAIEASETAFNRIRTRLAAHDYAYLLQKAARPLARVAGEASLALIADLLVQAGEAAGRMSQHDRTDHSAIWYPRIDEDETFQSGVLAPLTLALRDSGLELAMRAPERLEAVIATIEERGYPVFRRIALYILAHHPTDAPALATARLCDPTLLHDGAYRIEYGALAVAWFPTLSEEQKQLILESAQHPPADDWAARRARFEAIYSRRMTAEEESQARDNWFRDRVHEWRSVLPAAAADRLARIVALSGEPRPPGIQVTSAGLSPEVEEMMRGLSPQQLVAYVRTWKADTDPSLDEAHLAYQVAAIVKIAAGAFAAEALGFADLRPLVLQRYLEGMRDAAEGGLPSVGTLLELAERVAADEAPCPPEGRALLDAERRDARRAVADLLRTIIARAPADLPLDAAERVIKVLARLLEDASPSPEDDGHPRFGLDPYIAARTTVRGAAVDALLQCVVLSRQPEAGLPGLGALVPDLMRLVDRHLDPQTEPSRAVRSVYGAWLSRLAASNPAWTASNLRRVLPDTPDQAWAWQAAWSGFIRHGDAHPQVLEHIREDFGRAIDEIADTGKADPETEEYLGLRLAEYLWIDALAVEDDLLQRFLIAASPQTRRGVLRRFGVSLPGRAQAEAEVGPPGLYRRLQRYMDLRLAVWQTDRTGGFDQEFEGFGVWVDRPGFAPEWVLGTLEAVISAGALPEYPIRTVEWLAEHWTVSPAACLRCLDGLLRRLDAAGPEHRDSVDLADPAIQEVLAAALKDPSVTKAAEGLVGWLLARGHDDFAALLNA